MRRSTLNAYAGIGVDRILGDPDPIRLHRIVRDSNMAHLDDDMQVYLAWVCARGPERAFAEIKQILATVGEADEKNRPMLALRFAFLDVDKGETFSRVSIASSAEVVVASVYALPDSGVAAAKLLNKSEHAAHGLLAGVNADEISDGIARNSTVMTQVMGSLRKLLSSPTVRKRLTTAMSAAQTGYSIHEAADGAKYELTATTGSAPEASLSTRAMGWLMGSD